MKKSEIAARVFETVDALTLGQIGGGELAVPIDEVASLSMVPWFCNASAQCREEADGEGEP
jgi:hypothetical protein